ncbi:redox-sensitive transcriptional activator SoxR [Chromobacterium sp. IIBBL 290-4]|uniref:redox-sensitive transcriptional activator SoxR n=1 Tax=Chromobacterium sp. IIBBL 290-4 TaxID=2953890 RepID=UPI0020B7ACA9|nr:redox-sensitive transcriptional activator SoxR [Chromobacterium sp. IIBBL 290-4]UTH73680.1 redox-sensitive transcriptional activator SoxR [Chromobacterium sp. IIBBL 290-4]
MSEGWISIGRVVKRTGVAASALRFYESKGLIRSVGEAGKTRHYHRDVIRRVSFIRIAQSLGMSLQEIADALSRLPLQRTPSADDWALISQAWRGLLQNRIDALSQLRDKLDSCIGCGCLSLHHCQLYNPGDAVGKQGPGPRFLTAPDSESGGPATSSASRKSKT